MVRSSSHAVNQKDGQMRIFNQPVLLSSLQWLVQLEPMVIQEVLQLLLPVGILL